MTILNDNLNNLSKEELLKLLLSQQAKLQEKDLIIKTQEKLVQDKDLIIKTQEKLVQEKDQQINVLENKVSEYQKTNNVMANLIIAGAKEANEILLGLDDEFLLLEDDFLSKSLEEQIKIAIGSYNLWVAKAVTYFKNSKFATTGPDVAPTKATTTNEPLQKALDNTEQAQKTVDNFNRSLKNSKKNISKIINTLEHLANSNTSKSDMYDKYMKILSSVFNIKAKHKQELEDKTLKGRVAKKDRYNKIKAKKSRPSKIDSDKYCRTCKKDSEWESLGQIRHKCLADNQKQREALEQLENINDVYICKECGQCKILYTKEQDYPVIPNRELGMTSIARACAAIYHGIPMQRALEPLVKTHEFGNDTWSYNVHDFVAIYLTPLYEMIYKKAQDLKVLLADETPFVCLQAQGRGHMSKEILEKIDKDGLLNTNSKNYLLVLSSPQICESPLVYYRYMDNRSQESIDKILNEDFKCEYLVTDAYAAYNAIAQKLGAKHQNCIIHLRRLIINCINLPNVASDFNKLSEDEIKKHLKKNINSKGTLALVLGMFIGIRKIYEIEASLPYSLDNIKKRQENRQNLKSVFDSMDNLAKDYVDELLTYNEKTQKYSKKVNTPLSKMLVYYMNQRANFDVFLEDALVPPDSNVVERHIRGITIIRNAIKHKVNEDYCQDLCIIYTIWRTLELNGYDVEEFLHDYCCALHNYCKEERLTQHIQDGGVIGKQIKGWDMKALSANFDFSRYDIFKK